MNRVFGVFIVLCIANSVLAEDASELINNSLIRDTAFVSGRLKWVEGGSVNYQLSKGKIDIEFDVPRYASFSNDDWALGGKCFVISKNDWGYPSKSSFNDVYVEISPNKDPTAGNITVKNAIPISQMDINSGNAIPYWIGGYADKKIKNWIKENIEKFNYIKDDVVNGIPVKVCQATVPKPNNQRFNQKSKEFNPTEKVNPLSLGKNDLTLRVNIAPELGYVVVRLESITNGKVIKRDDALNFEKKSNIWLPKNIDLRIVSSINGDINNKTNCKYYLYEILESQLINEEIPDTDFIVTKPANMTSAVVNDYRGLDNKRKVTKIDNSEIVVKSSDFIPKKSINYRMWSIIIFLPIMMFIFYIVYKKFKNPLS